MQNSKQNQFVFLRHSLPEHSDRESHFDLMFQFGASLLTWTSHHLPDSETSSTTSRIDDHRLAFLEYEGQLTNDRGAVSRVAKGRCRVILAQENEFRFEIESFEFTGVISFVLDAKDSHLNSSCWRMGFVSNKSDDIR